MHGHRLGECASPLRPHAEVQHGCACFDAFQKSVQKYIYLSIACFASALASGLAATLVELLVVIAIIRLLNSLLLPAVQAVRRASDRTERLNWKRQRALGEQPQRKVPYEFEWHWTEGAATAAIEAPDDYRESMLKCGRLARERGAIPVGYMLWERTDSPAYCPLGEITASCEQAIREVQKGDCLADIAAVGPAWKAVLDARPDLVLHDAGCDLAKPCGVAQRRGGDCAARCGGDDAGGCLADL